ncbi:MAG: hypothetical protein ACRD1Y_00515 [Terriglobales bacterium]
MSLGPALMLPYAARLISLCLATGAAVYAVAATAAHVGAPVLLHRIGRRETSDPRHSAALVLHLRLAPLSLAALAVVVVCLPSYVFLEPRGRGPEAIGWVCGALAVAGAVLLAVILARSSLGAARAWRFGRRLRRQGHLRQADGLALRVLPAPAPALAIAGIWRPQLVASEAALHCLGPDQLHAALRHEQAHQHARDNAKRLLLGAAPLPGAAARALEARWARLAEWAADDWAVTGDAAQSLTLASALLAVARLRAHPPARWSPCVSTLDAFSGQDLAERIARLLRCDAGTAAAPPRRRWVGYAVLGALLWATLQPTTLSVAHIALERLLH